MAPATPGTPKPGDVNSKNRPKMPIIIKINAACVITSYSIHYTKLYDDLAILVNPKEKAPPSNEGALKKFEEAAKKLCCYVDFITRDDYNRIGEYDAMFIRETTSVNHYTYRFARRGEAEGLAVIDS